MANKKILLNILLIAMIEVLGLNAFATTTTSENSSVALLNYFTISDINQLYQNCGDINSRADICAEVAYKIVTTHFKNVKPITSQDVNLFWQECYDEGDNKQCAANINYLLKTHMPLDAYSSVSESDVEQVKSVAFINKDASYSALLKQVDDFFIQE